ncbi:MAG: biotin transporter BioY [Methylocystis sp.]|nr:biotin transporter BioY [Methylocystis sp.]MCA3583101.1 biotin transporter BioY [Methylocystis sp.]MCA3588394.1 biotin transporter BioY [Methylocystis sp.]MCA3593250.1 biotin transporter BioY [Methylocystis sp.]
MAQSTLTADSGPLIDRIWAVGEQKLLRQAILAVAGVALLTLSAKVQVPFYPVPMTLQTLVVLLIGAAYGWRLGAVTVGLYLLQGLAGLPVFANSWLAGPAYFLGPTAGFLVAFMASAAITGYAVEKGAARSLPLLAAAMLLAQAVVFAVGALWLAQFAQLANGAHGVGFARAWAVVQTFLPGDLLKTAIAVALVSLFAHKTAG